MYKIQNLTSNAKQRQTLVLPDGSQILISLYFCPMQLGWFIPRLEYGSFVLNNMRIVNSPNMLHQFRNKIPFGLACFSSSKREPSLQDDFSNAASTLYILTEAEVQAYTEYLSGQV